MWQEGKNLLIHNIKEKETYTTVEWDRSGTVGYFLVVQHQKLSSFTKAFEDWK
jgi:hypothetical protein